MLRLFGVLDVGSVLASKVIWVSQKHLSELDLLLQMLDPFQHKVRVVELLEGGKVPALQPVLLVLHLVAAHIWFGGSHAHHEPRSSQRPRGEGCHG